MFLDLTSSTTHAEHLGHIRYSQLLQDCFLDLTEVVMEFNGEVYQYVGDEVVLTWKLDKTDANTHCLHTYFGFKRTLESKKAVYNSKYGFLPEFKAGAHAGRVTVAEVGEIKREIAFHGDVLNTAARIRSKCNEFAAPLLVSETVRATVGDKNGYIFNKIGDVDLRGKQKAVSLHSVEYPLPTAILQH